MGLTALDMIVLILVGGGAALGAVRGFVTEVLSLFAWVAVIFALKLLHGPMMMMLGHVIGTPAGAAVAAFAVIVAVVFFGGKLVAASLGRRTRQSVLGPLDRALGTGFGALKGLILATLIFLLASLAYDTAYGGASPRPEWMRASRSYPLLNASGRALVDFVDRRRHARPAADDGNQSARGNMT